MKTLLLLLTFAGGLMAQAPQPIPPDCVITISNWNSNRTSADYANYFNGCDSWTMVVNVPSTVSALSVQFESAPMATNTGTPTPGAYVAFAGTVDTGVNPIISASGGTTTFSNGTVSIPFVHVALTGYTGTGNINGVVYGYKTGYPGGSTVTVIGACPNPCPVINGPSTFAITGQTAAGSPPTTPPVLQGFTDGTNVQTAFVCNSQAPIALSATNGSLQLVGLTASTIIHVCGISLSWDTSANVFFLQGTGSNCAAAIVNLTGTYTNATALSLTFTPQAPLNTTVAANEFCINTSQAITGGGVITYAKF